MTTPAAEVPPVEQLEAVAAVTAASITWKKTPPGVSTVLRRTVGDTPAQSPGDGTAVDVPAGASRATDLGLAPSTTYTWTAWNTAGGTLSDPVSVTAQTGPPPPQEAVDAQQAADGMAPYIAAAILLLLAGDGTAEGGAALAGSILGALQPFWDAEYTRRGGTARDADWELFVEQMTGPLSRTKPDGTGEQADRIAEMSAQAIVNQITHALAGDADKTWWTMLDSRVRSTHRPLHAATVPAGQPFLVGPANTPMDYPGQPVGDPELFMGCRCILTLSPRTTTAAGGPAMTDDQYVDDDLIPLTVPWWGVLAPEGEPSSKGTFAAGSLTWAEPPLHLRWQEKDLGEHDGAVVVASIDRIWREDGKVYGAGRTSDSEAGDRAVGALMDGDAAGVSIDLDEGELSAEGDGTWTAGRVRGATLVHIPAFVSARVGLGEPPEALAAAAGVSEAPWDGSASRFTPEQWRRSCIVHLDDSAAKSSHKLPIREPDGTLSRAGVHAAAARIGQVDAPPAELAAARERLRRAYRDLGEDAPDGLTASAFARGPGWVTDPAATRRLHDYWVRGEGAKKIRWGTPGDFRRLRRHLAKYINPLYLNRTVAQWHKDALGYWPGECGRPGNPPCGKKRGSRDAEAVTAAALREYPHEWFDDPRFDGPTPLTVTADGRVYGHLATWNTCHIGITGRCTKAPGSKTGYALFRTGAVLTDRGRVSVGNLTAYTGHAHLEDEDERPVDFRAAAAHYDDTGTVVADVAAGEDEHGIWVAGAVRDGLTDQQLHALQAGALSGDWRGYNGNLELVAALVVNVPGFPVPRPALAASAATGISPVLPASERVAAVRAVLDAERVAVVAAAMRR